MSLVGSSRPKVRRLARRALLPLAAIALVAGCGTVADPSAPAIRERAENAQVGLDARLTPLMRQQEILADWRADYCVDDPFTTAEWDCFATRNIAVAAPDLHITATAVDTELTRLGCHPEGDPERMGLGVMLDHSPADVPAHELPPVEFQCGVDRLTIQPSDRTDPRHGTLQRPGAWPAAATGESTSRLLGGGTIARADSDRLVATDQPFLLLTAARAYPSG